MGTLVSGSAFGKSSFGGVAVGGGYIYWTWEDGIGRAKLDGSEPDKEFITGIEGITGVTVGGSHLYWSGGGGNVGRANVDGSEVEPHFITGIPGGSVDGVAVTSEYIYWTNFWDSVIGRAKLDGAEVQQEWVVGTHTPEGLAASSEYLYWAITYENHIGRVKLDGSGLTTNFITTGLSSNGNEDVGLTVYGQHIYWVNPTTGTVGRANLDGSEIEPSFITEAGSPLGITAVGSPEAATKPAAEVTSSSAVVNATVDPDGAEVSECVFEYGTSTSYGSTAPCVPSPGSGGSPVAVSATLAELAPNTVYHFRVEAQNSQGASFGADETLTTLLTSSTGEAKTAEETAEAAVPGLSAKATGGKGEITAGAYGSNIGGTALANGKGGYFQVFRSAGSTFTKIEYKDCDLGGAKTLWWDDPETGWEPIQEPTAVYSESPACVTVTATASTRPSIAQLLDPRHVGGPSATEQVGKCVPAKHGHFEDSGCTKEKFKEKGEVRSYKGKYEWHADPVTACYPLKHGHFEDSACKNEKFKEKGGVKSYKGKYELGVNVINGTGGTATLQEQGESAPGLECATSSYSDQQRTANEGVVTLVLTGCEREGTKCESGSTEGTIQSAPLETYMYEESGEYLTVMAAKKLLSYKCSTAGFVLGGTAAGQLKASLNTPITVSEATFGGDVGVQELELEETGTQTRRPVTLATKLLSTTEQAIEIRSK